MDIRPIRSEADYDAALKDIEPYFEHEPELGTPRLTLARVGGAEPQTPAHHGNGVAAAPGVEDPRRGVVEALSRRVRVGERHIDGRN